MIKKLIKIYFKDGEHITTSINKQVSDEEIINFYKFNNEFKDSIKKIEFLKYSIKL